ncbi:MAG: energy-coupling factor transporter ATPase [Anaerolineae bacterium]|nr:energy-coupling factor transporter ATPase [Anaerolineae bacterium]
MSFVRIDDLTHTYTPPGRDPVPALCGIDLEIEAGEYVAIVGANGSGKTTLARHLNALLLPTSGDVWVNGHNTRDPSALRTIRAAVGMVFQSPADQIVATVVEEDVAFGPENLSVPHEELSGVVRSALERVGMWHARHRPPHLLSAGQQQRIAIAGVLAMGPRCLVCDEATSMLDPAGRRDVLCILDDLHHAGLTILSVTHSMTEAARAERVIALHQGRIALDGRPDRVFASEMLPSLGLMPPPATELGQRLRPYWPSLSPALLTADELAEALIACARAEALA